jgi:exodeoxyribonuclease III
MSAMKIASFNVNSVRARLPVVLSWLRQRRPDVLAMQETKVQDENFPKTAFAEAGYSCVFRGQKSYNGVAWAVRDVTPAQGLPSTRSGAGIQPRIECSPAFARASSGPPPSRG